MFRIWATPILRCFILVTKTFRTTVFCQGRSNIVNTLLDVSLLYGMRLTFFELILPIKNQNNIPTNVTDKSGEVQSLLKTRALTMADYSTSLLFGEI